ncbi:MAG: transporter substrate-binding domain-containing protein, partial [Planctomycetaceae bacterium]|nr:transporter substrate-binding domain-containing protein [Planctomycetaceae bacterium]
PVPATVASSADSAPTVVSTSTVSAEADSEAPSAGPTADVPIADAPTADTPAADATTADASVADSAVDEEAVVRVGLFDILPFVMPEGSAAGNGYAADLWREVAARLRLDCRYTRYKTIGELFTAVAEGREDVAVTALTINMERARWCRFSFPWYDSGMAIMVRDDDRGIWYELRQNRYIRFYVLFILVLCVLSYLIMRVRRGREPDFPEDWKDGFFLSLFNLMVLIREGQLAKNYTSWKGNLLTIAWTLFGVAAVTYVTSTLTAAMMAVAQDQSAITSVSDLGGHKVGALEGGLAQRYLDQLQHQVVAVKNVEEGVDLLEKGRIEAFVSDYPVLLFWSNTHREKNLRLTGTVFHPEKFGFAINRDKPELAERVTLELISMHDDGTTERIANRYHLEYSGARLEP